MVVVKRVIVMLLCVGFLFFGCCAAAPSGGETGGVGGGSSGRTGGTGGGGGQAVADVVRTVVALEMSCQYDQAQAYKTPERQSSYYGMGSAERMRMKEDCERDHISLKSIDVLSENVQESTAQAEVRYCFTSDRYPDGKCLYNSITLEKINGLWKIA